MKCIISLKNGNEYEVEIGSLNKLIDELAEVPMVGLQDNILMVGGSILNVNQLAAIYPANSKIVASIGE